MSDPLNRKILAVAFALAACFLCTTATPSAGLDAADAECPPYIWIAHGGQMRQPDGAVTQRYHIRGPGGAWPDCERGPDLRAVYHLRERFSREESVYIAAISCKNGDMHLDIDCGANARLELFVGGTCGRARYMAQTSQHLFGEASSGAARVPAPADASPGDAPRLNLTPSPGHYWMQTGETYQFNYTGGGSAVKAATILENQKRIADIPMSDDGAFAYIPPHDSRLDREGPSAFKDTVVLVEESGDGRRFAAAHTLLLHRSRTGHFRMGPGLVLFGGSAAFITLLVFYKRRSRSF
ncbi:MAG: hypothetical protein GY859_02135 [Desulfobacterales bacterium]|nr:hypothetical protein [Desulfobacterales bacterium]